MKKKTIIQFFIMTFCVTIIAPIISIFVFGDSFSLGLVIASFGAGLVASCIAVFYEPWRKRRRDRKKNKCI